MRPVLFFDFDNMLVDTDQMQRDFILKEYGVNLPRDVYLCGNSLCEIVNSFLPPDRQVEKHQFYDHWCNNLVMSHKLHEPVKPIPGVMEYLPRIARRYDSWVVTARVLSGRSVAEKLCLKFFGDAISGMHFVWSNGESKTRVERSKKDFIANFSGHKVAFFDDNPGEIRKVQGVIPSFLFDPLGIHKEERDIPHVVRSWSEIARTLL